MKKIILENFPNAENMTDEELNNECFQDCKDDEKHQKGESEDKQDDGENSNS